MSQADFAKRVDSTVELLERIEGDVPLDQRHGLPPVLERIADAIGTTIDTLLFADTSLFTVRVNGMKMRAWELIREHDWTSSLKIIVSVFEQIEELYNKRLVEREIGAVGFRNQGLAWSLDAEIVYEMVQEAKRRIVAM